jgi:hypothetical protein
MGHVFAIVKRVGAASGAPTKAKSKAQTISIFRFEIAEAAEANSNARCIGCIYEGDGTRRMPDRVTRRIIGHIFLGVRRTGESIASQSQRRLTRRPYEGNGYVNGNGVLGLAGPASGVYSGGYYLV